MKLWPSFLERRAEARWETNLEARFVVYEAATGRPLSTPCPAQVINLSRGGCCLALDRLYCGGFHLHHCLQAPQDYRLELILYTQTAPLTITGELRWLNREPGQQAMPFRAGLAFSEALKMRLPL